MANKKNSGSTGPNVPKEKAKKPSQPAKKPTGVKPVQTKKSEPQFHLCGKKRVAFIEAARSLAEDLRLTYGGEMSINKFGRILVELKGQNSLRDMVYLEQSMLDKFHSYEKSKSEMIEEQNLFRSSFSTPSFGMNIPEKVDSIFDVDTRFGAADDAAPQLSFRDNCNASTASSQ
jgi:hypothetical protein